MHSLIQAVEDSLKSVNLFHSGFGDKSVSKYSGGMKRRLSVAIALIGNPKVLQYIVIESIFIHFHSTSTFTPTDTILKAVVFFFRSSNFVTIMKFILSIGCLHGRTKFWIGSSIKESTVECCDVCQTEQGHHSDKYHIPPKFSDTA